ncbi:DNA polymerase III subunit alpha [Mycoplasmopsis gallinarum]|uniref:DNA polymerase III subunit alpha n=1 Tax=Mycoplasmopsis gallinarum TaxID=29557 RepID=UPI0004810541|nr:DNA polymerase III subunit alpha [Mycoplasmopsis gallinarum]
MKLVQLYNTTEYSFLESTIRIKNLVKDSKANELEAVVLTDYNNLFGLGIFLEECQKNNIKGIVGVDLDLEINGYRFIILAKNYQGYQKINELILKRNSFIKIIIDELDDENIYVLDHPTHGFFAKTKQILNFSNFYLPFSSETRSFNNVVFLRKNNLMNGNEIETLKTLATIGQKNVEITANYSFQYFENLENLPHNVIENTKKIVENCNLILPKVKLHLANYENLNKKESYLKFIELINKGIQVKENELVTTPIWQERLKKEIDVIISLKFFNYFLIIQDLIQWAKNNGIKIGPGRGSAAGSLVSYLLGITEINPLKYDLLFERFLNYEKASWPDIDIDIQDDRRAEVFAYLKNKYGYEYTALISTFQTIGAKSAIRDVGRVLNLPITEINKISKSIYTNTLQEAYETSEFKSIIKNNSEYDKLLYPTALKIEGLPRQFGYHPAGFIISDVKISSLVPVMPSSETDFLQIQLPMNYLESFGLLKIDLLGLKTLTEVNEIEKFLPKEQTFDYLLSQGVDVLNDEKTFNILNQGFTEGIFQLESTGMTRTIKKVKIDKFDDLYAIISLFRPGPMKYIDIYAQVKNKKAQMNSISKEYDEIVKNTYGIIVYQEQIMQIAEKIAGFSFTKADFLRKAISKKEEEKLKTFRSDFVNGAKEKGLNEQKANEIFDIIEEFGLYGFNKSHAVSYAYLTMKMAYYKTHQPFLFYNALITSSQGAQETILSIVKEAKELNFKINSPNIYFSSQKSEIYKNEIYLPFSMIKGFGNEGINKILKDREENGNYSSNILDTLLRLRFAGLKDNAIEILIKSNVFRDYGNMNFIISCDNLTKQIYGIFDKKTSYKENIKKFPIDTYETKLDELNSQSEIDYAFEIENETKYLGGTFNIFPTSKFEVIGNNLALFNKINTIQYFPVEILDINFKYKMIKFRDSSKEVTSFINQEEIFNKFKHLTKGEIIKMGIKRDSKQRYLPIEWGKINE